MEVQFPVTTYWVYLSRKDSNNIRALLSLQRSRMMGTDVCPLPIDGWRLFISLLGGVRCVLSGLTPDYAVSKRLISIR